MSTEKAPPEVLVVDDNIPTCRMLVRLIEQTGYRARCLESGAEALDYLESCEPKLIFLDVSMPGMDGFEVLKKIRQSQNCRHVAVFMYSAFSDSESRIKAERLGANGYIIKGHDTFDVIRSRLKEHVHS